MKIIIIVIAPKTGFPRTIQGLSTTFYSQTWIYAGGFWRAPPPFFDKLSCDFLLGYKTQALNMSTKKKFRIRKHRKRQ